MWPLTFAPLALAIAWPVPQAQEIAWRSRNLPGQDVAFRFALAEFAGHTGIEPSGSGRDRTFTLEEGRVLVIRTLELGWESPVLLFLEPLPDAPERSAASLRSLRAWEWAPLAEYLSFGEPIDGADDLVAGTDRTRELELWEGLVGELGCRVAVRESVVADAADLTQSLVVARSWESPDRDGFLCEASGDRLLSLEDRIVFFPSSGLVRLREREYTFLRSTAPDYYVHHRIEVEETAHEQLLPDAFDREGQLLFEAWCLSRPDPVQARKRLADWEALPQPRLADVASLVSDLVGKSEVHRRLLVQRWAERLRPVTQEQLGLSDEDLDAAFQAGLVATVVDHAGLDERVLERAMEADLAGRNESTRRALLLAFRLAHGPLSWELEKVVLDGRLQEEAHVLLEEALVRYR